MIRDSELGTCGPFGQATTIASAGFICWRGVKPTPAWKAADRRAALGTARRVWPPPAPRSVDVGGRLGRRAVNWVKSSPRPTMGRRSEADTTAAIATRSKGEGARQGDGRAPAVSLSRPRQCLKAWLNGYGPQGAISVLMAAWVAAMCMASMVVSVSVACIMAISAVVGAAVAVSAARIISMALWVSEACMSFMAWAQAVAVAAPLATAGSAVAISVAAGMAMADSVSVAAMCMASEAVSVSVACIMSPAICVSVAIMASPACRADWVSVACMASPAAVVACRSAAGVQAASNNRLAAARAVSRRAERKIADIVISILVSLRAGQPPSFTLCGNYY